MSIEVTSCGVVVFRRAPEPQFLLLRKPGRYDFAKGHLEPGETDVQCALRELREETGIPEQFVELDVDFRCTLRYPVWDKYLRADALKTLILFLGWLRQPVDLVMTEHDAYEWRAWRPPPQIQERTIDPALAAIQRHWETGKGGATT